MSENHDLETLRAEVRRRLDRVLARRAERLEDYPLARLSRWTLPLEHTSRHAVNGHDASPRARRLSTAF